MYGPLCYIPGGRTISTHEMSTMLVFLPYVTVTAPFNSSYRSTHKVHPHPILSNMTPNQPVIPYTTRYPPTNPLSSNQPVILLTNPLSPQVFHPLFMGPLYVGAAIFHFQEITTTFPLFWVGALALVAFIEGQTILNAWGTVSPMTGVGNLKEEYYPGDLGFDPLGLSPKDGGDFFLMQSQELDLGRYAMLGVLGMIAQECVDGKGIIEHVISQI